MNDLQAFHLFTRVARLGSFSAAAREAGMAQSQVSRIVASLEAELGTRLLSRTTRAVLPTQAGLAFLERIEPLLPQLEDAANSIREGGELRGLLRIAMPVTLGTRVVIPRLAEFTQRHPRVRVELMLDDRWQDMVRDAVDVGLRVGRLPDSTGTARLIGTMSRVVVASPAYLRRCGTPIAPSDLSEHRIVGGPVGAQAAALRWERDGVVHRLDPASHLSIDNTEGVIAAIRSGLGIGISTSWACQAELQAGTLVQLLREWRSDPLPVHAYFPQGRAARMAARAFVEHLSAALGEEQGFSPG